jgi:integral membrane sensor domain MASE1
MKTRIIISTLAAFIVAGVLLSPPDPFSLLVNGALTAILCFIPLFILSRFRFVESAAGSVQTLVCVLVCMLALSVFLCLVMSHRISALQYDLNHHRNTNDSSTESSGT